MQVYSSDSDSLKDSVVSISSERNLLHFFLFVCICLLDFTQYSMNGEAEMSIFSSEERMDSLFSCALLDIHTV